MTATDKNVTRCRGCGAWLWRSKRRRPPCPTCGTTQVSATDTTAERGIA